MKKAFGYFVSAFIFTVTMTACGGGGGGGAEPLSSAKAITAYSLAGVAGAIDETAKTISVTVPYGTNITVLVATFTTTGAGVTVGATAQTSGTTPNDFTSPVTYTVTAADSTTAAYTVTVTIALNSAKAIKTYSLAGVRGTIDEDFRAKTISVTVPYGTRVTDLVATFTTTGVSVKVGTTVQYSKITPNDFSRPVVYTVTAANGTTTTYTVTVTVAPNSAKAITDFSLAGVEGTIYENTKSILVILPAGTNVTALAATYSTTGASVRVGAAVQTSGTTTNDFTDPVAYTVIAADASTATYTVTVALSAVNLPRTGQFISYVAGDDGELQKGVSWPGPRFTVDGDCVIDGLTGLMWVRTPDSTTRTWTEALAYANGLSRCNHSDWRLPNIRELRSLVNYGQSYAYGWLISQDFSNVQPEEYWTSTTLASDPTYAWFIGMFAGTQNGAPKAVSYRAWPVRSGSVAPANLAKTGQTTCYDAVGAVIPCTNTGQDGEWLKGVAWPNPRFVVDGTGYCVTDMLTGLMWVRSPDSTKRNWADAVPYANDLSLCGFTDWRLPNVNELESLLNSEQADTAAWLIGQGFGNVQSLAYWSSTTYRPYSNYSWIVFTNSGIGATIKDQNFDDYKRIAWPVRSGQ